MRTKADVRRQRWITP